MKLKRFFFHYFRAKRKMSVHFEGKCYTVTNVHCRVPCETHYNKRQPFLIMRGWAEDVKILADTAVIR